MFPLESAVEFTTKVKNFLLLVMIVKRHKELKLNHRAYLEAAALNPQYGFTSGDVFLVDLQFLW